MRYHRLRPGPRQLSGFIRVKHPWQLRHSCPNNPDCHVWSIPVTEARFEAVFAEPAPLLYNAAPSQRLPVITNAAPNRIQLLRWGLVPAG